ncbi:GNAT family N-acetyltransferase [Pedobacter ginsengisoli]|uniref:GNAT family N-acetyltransferase n=1 Tax=Pedobacter ginsengisoli TaxID=363852 RepID=UPI00255060D9|nr:GNAT family N-acetyltransferase [Pedobacter ginsengisoli]
MEIICHKLGATESAALKQLVQLYASVFEMEDFKIPDNDYLQSLLEKESISFFVATDASGQVLGGLTAYMLPSVYYTACEVYIYDLAVDQQWQRKGIGRKLIDSLKQFCKGLGCRYIFVQADLEDQHAIDFYHATGGLREEVVHFDYRL